MTDDVDGRDDMDGRGDVSGRNEADVTVQTRREGKIVEHEQWIHELSSSGGESSDDGSDDEYQVKLDQSNFVSKVRPTTRQSILLKSPPSPNQLEPNIQKPQPQKQKTKTDDSPTKQIINKSKGAAKPKSHLPKEPTKQTTTTTPQTRQVTRRKRADSSGDEGEFNVAMNNLTI